MKLIQVLKTSFWALVIALLFYSCNGYYTSNFSNYNDFVNADMYYHYLNDSLKLQIKMFGDYYNGKDTNEIYLNRMPKRVFKEDKKIVKNMRLILI